MGKFLDAFETIADQSPPYLSAKDWQRHRDLVQLLKGFSCRHHRLDPSGAKITAADFPLNALEHLLQHWVQSTLRMDHAHPLAPTFALDTATILHEHAFGRDCYGRGDRAFEIEAMVENENRDKRYGKIADQMLKKEITQRTMHGLHVYARLPEDARALCHDDQQIVSDSGAIWFLPMRCHQSSVSTDQHELVIEAGAEPQFDLSSDFEFFGSFVIRCREAAPEDRWDWWNYRPVFSEPGNAKGILLVNGYLPIRWITHCGYPRSPEAMTALPERWTSLQCGQAENTV